jgi:Domain of unknown function (DUF4439)
MSDPIVVALLAVAAAENAAIYGYPMAGARLDLEQDRVAARTAYTAHRTQLLTVGGWLADRGSTPAAAAPLYDLPSPLADAASARALLAAMEESTAAAYADLVAVTSGPLQRAAALALQSAAVRETAWRTTSVPFPGLLGRLPAPPR